MPYSRLIPTLVILCLIPRFGRAQQPEPTPATPPAQAQAPDQVAAANGVLAETAIQLKLRARIAASIVQDVDMLNQKFTLKGNYYKDTGNRVRLQLDLIGLGDTGSTMLQVCDGKVLWEFRKVLGMQDYRRRDLVPILQRLENQELDDYFRSLIMTQIGFGGPEALVRGLQKSVKFDKVEEKNVDGFDCWIVSGGWADRSGLTSPGEPALRPNAQLPGYIPSEVSVYIDKKAIWPFKVEMVGKDTLIVEDTRQVDPATGRPVGPKKAPPKVDPSHVIMRYTLLPDAEIKPEVNFAFSAPKDAPNLQDDTEPFLQYIDSIIDAELKRKKSEAASKPEGDQPLLKVNPLEAPGATPARP